MGNASKQCSEPGILAEEEEEEEVQWAEYGTCGVVQISTSRLTWITASRSLCFS